MKQHQQQQQQQPPATAQAAATPRATTQLSTSPSSSPVTSPKPRTYSIYGRRRIVTDAQIERILEWRRNHQSARNLARELGLSPSAVLRVARYGFDAYKQPSPEHWQSVRDQRDARLNTLRRKHWIA